MRPWPGDGRSILPNGTAMPCKSIMNPRHAFPGCQTILGRSFWTVSDGRGPVLGNTSGLSIVSTALSVEVIALAWNQQEGMLQRVLTCCRRNTGGTPVPSISPRSLMLLAKKTWIPD